MSPDTLKGIAAVLNIIGSALLALRIKGLITAILAWLRTHEINFMRYHENPWKILTGGDEWANAAEKLWLFYLGFVLFGLAGILQLIAIFI